MLFLFLKFLYIVILSFVYGYTLQTFLQTQVLKNRRTTASFPLTTFTGLFTITIAASYLSLFIPLAAIAHSIILGGGIFCYLLQRKNIHAQVADYMQQGRTAGKVPILFFVAAVVYVLYLSAQQPFAYDEGLYYAQFIKWMQSYKVVPGLANLHTRFGFNSQWHVLSAIFNFSWLTGHSDNHINGVAYLLTVMNLLPSKQQPRFIALLKAGLLVMISMPQFCVYNIIAPAADLPIFYISCLIILLWLEHSSNGQSPLESSAGVFLLLAPLFLVTVKVSAIPVLLLTALLYLQVLRRQYYGRFIALLGIAVLLVAPWLIRTIILTGYPLFPMELPDFFHTDWAVPTAVVHATRQDITAFAFYRAADIQRYLTDSTLQRFSTWFFQNVRIYDKVLIVLAFLSPVLVIIRRRQLPEGFIPLYAFLLLGCSFWLIQAPDPRFGYSYLAPLVVLTGILSFPALQIRHIYLPVLLTVLLFQAGTLYLQHHLHKVFATEKLIVATARTNYWLTPAPYTHQTVIPHHTPFLVYTPDTNELCWDTPLPCADHLPPHVKMRGTSLADGFTGQ
jgi:hypothetical protein